ncbi:MAG TPA: helix-turn-helix domain-containing protein [Ktedonobacteraceae bacterium]|nr:helix-turn-helix domain-containing protein [Ktedonobacteraceae bacterium]
MLILPGVQLLDLAGPVQVFDTAARLFNAPYKLRYCGISSEVQTTQHLHLAHLEPLPEVDESALILIPGTSASTNQSVLDEPSRQWLLASHQAGSKIASICSGAGILGEAGLLHRRRCTTHWDDIAELQASYPTAQVLDGVLYVQDRGIITSAGVTSGIDMALWLLEQDSGPRLAAEVARQLVIYLRRSGMERQISIHLEYRSHLNPSVHKVQDWLAEHVSDPVSLADLAVVGQTSVRSLARAFKEATGITPREYLRRLRLELANHLIHDTDLSLESIAVKSGFGDARQFRRAWLEHFGKAPSVSRQAST